MRTIRFPIKGLMGAVLVVALGLAAVRDAFRNLVRRDLPLTCGVLCLAIVGVVCRRDEERAWWLGFALFGWGYLLLSMRAQSNASNPDPARRGGRDWRQSMAAVGWRHGRWNEKHRSLGLRWFRRRHWRRPRHSRYSGDRSQPLGVGVALLGGFLARAIFGGARDGRESRLDRASGRPHITAAWWLWPAALGLAGGGRDCRSRRDWIRSSPGFWVGTTFLATCGLLGMTILGVAGEKGKCRQIWLGAAIFGISYMTMAFGRSLDRETWPSLPTDHLLNTLRPWFPPVVSGFPTSSDGVAALNARIWETLQGRCRWLSRKTRH